MNVGQFELMEDPNQRDRWYFNRKNTAGERLVLEVQPATIPTHGGAPTSWSGSAKLYATDAYSYEEVRRVTTRDACMDLLERLTRRNWTLTGFTLST